MLGQRFQQNFMQNCLLALFRCMYTLYIVIWLLQKTSSDWLKLTFCLLLLPLWESAIALCFVVRYFMSILVLQSSWWGRESWLLYLICLPGVSWWLSGSSSRCHGVVCGLWLWYFLIILTYYFWLVMTNLDVYQWWAKFSPGQVDVRICQCWQTAKNILNLIKPRTGKHQVLIHCCPRAKIDIGLIDSRNKEIMYNKGRILFNVFD